MKISIPDTMLAIGVSESDELVVNTVPVPRPGRGEVLVRIAASPVNPSDLARIRQLNSRDKVSFIGGIEGSGMVVGHGKGVVPALLMNKRVSCASAHNFSGCWAEYMVTSAMSCVPLPKNVSDEQGSMMLVNPMTAAAFFVIIRKEKHTSVINTAGASALSRVINFLGSQQGINIINIVRSESQVQQLASMGIKHILNSADPDFQRKLNARAAEFKPTLALDAVGGMFTPVLTKALSYSGSIIIYGNLSGENPVLDHRALVNGNKKAGGFYLVNWLKEQPLPVKLSCILKSRSMLRENILVPVQARYTLHEVRKAVDTYLSTMSAGKVLLIP